MTMVLIASARDDDDILFEPASRRDAAEWAEKNLVMPEYWIIKVYANHDLQLVVGTKERGQTAISWAQSVPGYAWRNGRLVLAEAE